MRILFGIGNPGPEYERTRHNLGFEVLDLVADGQQFAPLPGLPAEAALVNRGADPLLLVKPLTYVNRCGPVLASLTRLTDTALRDAIVVVDDLDLAPGRLRLRARGSAGGHNGLRSIEAALGTDAYPRLRLGIGGAGAGPRPEYVLARFPQAERQAVDLALQRAREGLRTWRAAGLERAMESTNRRDLDPEGERV